MKKLLTFSVITALILIVSFTPEHTYKFSEKQVITIYEHENLLKQILPQSELKGREISAIIPAIDTIQIEISKQYKEYNDTTKFKK